MRCASVEKDVEIVIKTPVFGMRNIGLLILRIFVVQFFFFVPILAFIMETLNLKQSFHAIADELAMNATVHDALERLYTEKAYLLQL